jgi:Tfp pilus assembly protein PilN
MDKEEKSVTSEGVPSDLDLGNVPPPTQEDENSLDDALDAAGIFNKGDEPAPTADPDKPSDTPPDGTAPDPDKPAETPPGDPAPAAKTDEEKEQERIRDLEATDIEKLTPPEDISPKNVVNFQKLREVASHYKQSAVRVPELEKTIADLQAKLGSPDALPEPLRKELDELRSFRRIFDTENDPEFKKQFDEKISTLDNEVLDLMIRKGFPKEEAEKLRSMGIDSIPSDWWQKNVLEKLPFVDRERIQKRLAERADLLDTKQAEIQKFQAQRESTLAQTSEQREQEVQRTQAEINQHIDDITKELPWARYITIDDKMTPEDKTKAEAHNKEVDVLAGHLNEALFPKTTRARAEVAAAAVASVRLASSVRDLAARLKTANEESEKYKKQVEEIRLAGRAPRAAAVPDGKATPTPGNSTDEDAIEVGLREAEGALGG